MFIGIDHGTTSLRFSGDNGAHFKITREEATGFELSMLERLCPLNEIEGIALCYSMGDNFTKITNVKSLKNRGIVTQDGAGKHIGGGTKVFDTVAASNLPAIAFPGIHRESDTDPRFKIYSHQTSPEKIGIAYLVKLKLNEDSFVVSDISSNTVSLLISNNKIIGAFDACVFAPGTQHGALDVDAIRKIDNGEMTANEAFTHAGVSHHIDEPYQKPTVAMWAAMECASLLVLNPQASIALAGSLAPDLAEEISALLNKPVAVFDEWAASLGLALAARDVFGGAKNILGIEVVRPLPKKQ